MENKFNKDQILKFLGVSIATALFMTCCLYISFSVLQFEVPENTPDHKIIEKLNNAKGNGSNQPGIDTKVYYTLDITPILYGLCVISSFYFFKDDNKTTIKLNILLTIILFTGSNYCLLY